MWREIHTELPPGDLVLDAQATGVAAWIVSALMAGCSQETQGDDLVNGHGLEVLPVQGFIEGDVAGS